MVTICRKRFVDLAVTRSHAQSRSLHTSVTGVEAEQQATLGQHRHLLVRGRGKGRA
jgi:hypothetical protein